METQQQTFGQKAVGLSFNPSGDDAVTRIKQKYAEIIDELDSLRADRSERARLASVAITEAQGAQMWAVKALTWRDEPIIDPAPPRVLTEADSIADLAGLPRPSAA